ncbi:MAG: aminotransferase class III-fold pyridoxal phosphate-dependent enzyme [Alphaproteobacteria bacterium]|nr:aminotransferase class III-fold pyridoxal phosphate-dependent enzyme [Alphaproteobacteria bacterium]MDP6831089.1 aminotransferase class III-fold pyridoxal phosphate-dependent enzyme [Alphaproteobacteria bacterium]
MVPTLSAQRPTSPQDAGQTAFYAKSGTVPMPLIERAAGIHMWDSAGNRYIDVSSGPVVSNIGHGNAHVADAIAAQARTLDYAFPRLVRNRPNMDYTERLAALAGPGFERVCLTSGGSEAMENAIKFLRQYAVATGKPAKTQVITCQPSYHGATIATLAMNGDVMLAPFLDGLAQVTPKVPAPIGYRVPGNHDADSYARHCADCLEAKIDELGADNVLAFVIEPVGGLSTGAVVPPHSYFRRIREICNRFNVHLVFDEILCGMGRTGKFLAAHHWPDALPDIVTLAKGMASGYSPLGAVLAPASMVDELAGLSGFEFQYSYNANPISSAAGLAVLDEYERLDLVNRSVTCGERLRQGLKDLQTDLPIIGDIRGKGMLLAVELVADQASKAPLPNELQPTDRVRVHGMNNGLIIYSRPTSGGKYGHWFMVSPPLTITDDEISELLGRLGDTLRDLSAELL